MVNYHENLERRLNMEKSKAPDYFVRVSIFPDALLHHLKS